MKHVYSHLVSCPDHTSHEENGQVNQVKFVGLLLECDKDQWHCNTVNYYIAHTSLRHMLRCVKAQDCFPVLAFDLMLCCDDNLWSNFLRSIVLVMKAFQHQETQLSPHRNIQQEQRLLAICWMAWIVLLWVLYYPWSCSLFQLRRTWLTHLHSPSTTMGSRRQPKNGKQTHGQWRRLQKPSMGTHG